MTHKIGGGLGGPVEDFFQGAKESTIGAVGKAYRHNGPVKSLLFGGATVVAVAAIPALGAIALGGAVGAIARAMVQKQDGRWERAKKAAENLNKQCADSTREEAPGAYRTLIR